MFAVVCPVPTVCLVSDMPDGFTGCLVFDVCRGLSGAHRVSGMRGSPVEIPVNASLWKNDTAEVARSAARHRTRRSAINFPEGAVIGIIPKFGFPIYEGEDHEGVARLYSLPACGGVHQLFNHSGLDGSKSVYLD